MALTADCLCEMQTTMPLGISPAAMHGLAHPDGERATSRAAASQNVAMGLSSYATESLEDVRAAGGSNPYAMQLCVLRDRETSHQLIRRAEGKRCSPELYVASQLIIVSYSRRIRCTHDIRRRASFGQET